MILPSFINLVSIEWKGVHLSIENNVFEVEILSVK